MDKCLKFKSNSTKVSREMASRAKGSLTATAATVDALVSAIVTGGIEYDDVVKALNFDKVLFVVFYIFCLLLVLPMFIFTRLWTGAAEAPTAAGWE